MNSPIKQKTIIAILSVGIIILIGAAAYFAIIKKIRPAADLTGDSNINLGILNDLPNQTAYITYLVSQEDDAKFCNGVNMDSDGYRKTITTEVVSDIPKTGLTEAELAKQTAVLATDGMCRTAINDLNFKVTNGQVKIPAFGAWAGVSIVMCSCVPRVEVNLLRLSGIKQVVWESESAE